MSSPIRDDIPPQLAAIAGERRPWTFLQYDVFTREPLLGNQLAVFTDAQGFDGATMQRIAREMNFPESTFILPAEWAGTDIRMRIFTPAVEMPMAGHPTIGSTFALADTGVIKPGTPRFIFHLNAGPTPVELIWQGDRLAFAWMTQPNPVFGRVVEDRALVAATIGLTVDDLLPDVPVQEVSCAVPFLYVPLRDREAVDRAISDASAFKRLAKTTGADLPIFLFALDDRSRGETGAGAASRGEAAAAASASRNPAYLAARRPGSASADADREAGSAPADPPDGRAGSAPADKPDGRAGSAPAVTPDGRAGSASAVPPDGAASSSRTDPPDRRAGPVPHVTVYSRMFAPEFGIVEDPATGIASGPLGCYLVRHGLVAPGDARAIVSHQGVAMGRASRVHISIGVADGAGGVGGPVIDDVRVGGEAVLVARGELLL